MSRVRNVRIESAIILYSHEARALWESRPEETTPMRCNLYVPGYNMTPLWICRSRNALDREISLKTCNHIYIHTYKQTYMTWARFPSLLGLRLRAFGAQSPSELFTMVVLDSIFTNSAQPLSSYVSIFLSLSSIFMYLFLYVTQLWLNSNAKFSHLTQIWLNAFESEMIQMRWPTIHGNFLTETKSCWREGRRCSRTYL